MDDIPDDEFPRNRPASDSSGVASKAGTPEKGGRRTVGPEDETRGGAEAPANAPGKTVDDPANDPTIKTARFNPAAPRAGGAGVSLPDGMPGGRAALPSGSLPGPYLAPQGDEDRPAPRNAPSDVKGTVTVAAPSKDRKNT